MELLRRRIKFQLVVGDGSAADPGVAAVGVLLRRCSWRSVGLLFWFAARLLVLLLFGFGRSKVAPLNWVRLLFLPLLVEAEWILLCFLVGLLPGFLVLSPDLLRSCFGSSTAMGEWVAGSRSLTADVQVSRIFCGLPMCGVGFLVRMEVEVGGLMFWCTIKKFGEPYWRLGSYVFSFALAEGGLDSPLMGLFSELVTSSATADSVRSIHLVGAAGSFLFQDLDGDGRRTPEGRWFAATSWRSLSTSWLSSSPG